MQPPPAQTGLITAAASFAVNYGVENISGFKFKATLTLLASGHALASFVVYCAINAALVLTAVLLTTQIAPAAAGSGIAEVKVSGGSALRLLGDGLASSFEPKGNHNDHTA